RTRRAGLLDGPAALLENGVVDGGCEEGMPVLGATAQMVQAVTHVSQHAVDVEDRHSHPPTVSGGSPAWNALGMDFEAVKAGMPTLVPMVGTLNLEFL